MPLNMKKSPKCFHLFAFIAEKGWMHVGIYHSKYSMLHYVQNHKHMHLRYAYIVYDLYVDDDINYAPVPTVFSKDCHLLEV